MATSKNPLYKRGLVLIDNPLKYLAGTIGDPLCDVANLCMVYLMRPMPGIPGLAGMADLTDSQLQSLGVPTRRQVVQAYCREGAAGTSGRLSEQQVWEWSGYYLAFLFFKNCAIVAWAQPRKKKLKS